MTVPTTTTGLEAPTLAPLARCGSGCSRSVKRLVERKFSPTSSGGQGEEEVSSSTDADGVGKTGGFGQLQPGEAPASPSLLFHWIGEFLSLAPLAALVADAWVS